MNERFFYYCSVANSGIFYSPVILLFMISKRYPQWKSTQLVFWQRAFQRMDVSSEPQSVSLPPSFSLFLSLPGVRVHCVAIVAGPYPVVRASQTGTCHKADDLSSVPWTHTQWNGELTRAVLVWLPHVHCGMRVPHKHTSQLKIIWGILKDMPPNYWFLFLTLPLHSS